VQNLHIANPERFAMQTGGNYMLINNNEYFAVLEDIKTRIKIAQKSQQGVGFLPWRNNLTLMSKVKDEAARQWG
jgi:predicted ATPase